MSQISADVPDRLRLLTEQLLDERHPPHTLQEQAAELAELLIALGEVHPRTEMLSDGQIQTPNGLAVSSGVAATCARDGVRTIQYLRGVMEAITRIRQRHCGRPARILYVGCGPMATLATPLMSLLGPDQAQFTLIDFHPAAIASVRTLHRKLGVSDRVAGALAGDATTYRIDPECPPDLIMMEIMLAALETEPQVAITRHLLAQAPEALLIPEEVGVDLNWVDPVVEFGELPPEEERARRIAGGRAFSLNRETILAWRDGGKEWLPGNTLRTPQEIGSRHQPQWFTRMQIFGQQGLDYYDSGLTHPRSAGIAGRLRPGCRVRVMYRLGERPELVGEVDSDTAVA